MKKALTLAVALLAAFSVNAGAQTKTTFKFADRDTCSLYLDLYMPDKPVADKPVVLFMFGGGFISGVRDAYYYLPWFNALLGEGYPVVSIDYRLGLKNASYGTDLKFASALEHAIDIAVEDLYSATNFLLEKAPELGLEGRGIVTSGSSAGAVSVLQGEYYIANGLPKANSLPQGFNYAGVMAFSGAIFSRNGNVKYKNEPCPQMILHGISDNTVPYKQIKILNLCFGGGGHIAKSLKKEDRNYQAWHFRNHYHEISMSMEINFQRELVFLERNVANGEKLVIDAIVDDPAIPIPDWAVTSTKDLYN